MALEEKSKSGTRCNSEGRGKNISKEVKSKDHREAKSIKKKLEKERSEEEERGGRGQSRLRGS